MSEKTGWLDEFLDFCEASNYFAADFGRGFLEALDGARAELDFDACALRDGGFAMLGADFTEYAGRNIRSAIDKARGI